MKIEITLSPSEQTFFKDFIQKMIHYGFKDPYFIVEDLEFLSKYETQIETFESHRIFDVYKSHLKTPGKKFILRSLAMNLIKEHSPENAEKFIVKFQ